MNEFVLILGMMLVTFGVRYPVLALFSRIKIPDIIERGLRFVPPAVLSAIIAPEILMPDGTHVSFQLDNAPLFASLVTVLVAWRSKNLLLTIVAGMVALWGWQILVVG